MSDVQVSSSLIPLWLNILFLIIAIFGFADATYLAIAYYSGAELVCGPKGGCNIVTTSEYSTIGSVPVALLGSLYYVLIILLTVAYIDSKKMIVAQIRSWITVCGLLASGVFVYLQLAVIGVICTYCMVSAGVSVLLFGLGMYVLKRYPVFLRKA